ncbi:MAG TPA: polysaccharide pyruvyl transferase family protein [Clostridiales bacterium]|nr:polysaccharide pyruvyl transferase family protein [Clostridiales bacterium]
MRVGIVTLHRVFNYGSVLQAYATQRVIEKMGYQPFIVDYIMPHTKNFEIWKQRPPEIQGVLRTGVYHTAKLASIMLKKKTFGGFIKKHLVLTDKKYVGYSALLKNPPFADAFITGSDQVWNSYYNRGIDHAMFLKFTPKSCPRIAYASSFGKDTLDRTEIQETKELIQQYRSISVRENTAISILNSLGYKNGTWLIDPTLQISSREWSRLAAKPLVKDKYLVLMLLYNEDNQATEFARATADKLGLKLVKLSWELHCPKGVDRLFTHRGPEDFLSMFMNADYVVTNSFHGLAFSINFNCPFIVVPRKEFNSRIASLLELTGLQERLVNTKDAALAVTDDEIDYNQVNAILENERKRTECFLSEALQAKTDFSKG